MKNNNFMNSSTITNKSNKTNSKHNKSKIKNNEYNSNTNILISNTNLKKQLIEELKSLQERVDNMKIENLTIMENYENEINNLIRSNEYLQKIQKINRESNNVELEKNLEKLKEEIKQKEIIINEKDEQIREMKNKIYQLNILQNQHEQEINEIKENYEKEVELRLQNILLLQNK